MIKIRIRILLHSLDSDRHKLVATAPGCLVDFAEVAIAKFVTESQELGAYNTVQVLILAFLCLPRTRTTKYFTRARVKLLQALVGILIAIVTVVC